MALFLAGKTCCAICGRVIARAEDAVATQAFLRSSHPFARYSDAAFHRDCFERSPDRPQVEALMARWKEVMRQAPSTLAEYEKWIAQAVKEFS